MKSNFSTKLKNLLGGMALRWWFIVEWLLGAMSMVFFTRDWLTCGRPPRDKEIEVTPSFSPARFQ